MAEHASRVHARVRRRRGAGEHRDDRGRAAPHAARHPTCRDAGDRRAADLLRRASTTFRSSSPTPGRTSWTTRAPRSSKRPRYTGTGGIPIGNIFQRALFAWRFQDVNLLISGLIDADSRDHDLPRHPGARPEAGAVPEARRAIRTSRSWTAGSRGSGTPTRRRTSIPYSQSRSTWPMRRWGGVTGDANYIRNSVKVTVDAYNGDDDVLHLATRTTRSSRRGRGRSPTCSRPRAEASADLQAHFRYPGEPLPDPGVAVRDVPRDRSRGVLPEAGRLADPDRPDDPRRTIPQGAVPDASTAADASRTTR